MAEKLKASDIFEYCKQKNIKLSDEVVKKINDAKEIGKGELKNVTGGCTDPVPDSPKCKHCGSTNTKTEYAPPVQYVVTCRNCGASYTEEIIPLPW